MSVIRFAIACHNKRLREIAIGGKLFNYLSHFLCVCCTIHKRSGHVELNCGGSRAESAPPGNPWREQDIDIRTIWTLVLIDSGVSFVTMAYDQENRLAVHGDGSDLTTFTYSADNLKRTEREGADVTT